MKNTFKKSLLVAVLSVISTSAIAAAQSPAPATGVFQWVGSVQPANEEVDTGLCIDVASGANGAVDHDSGLLTFHNRQTVGDAETHDILTSTELAYQVKTLTSGECEGEIKPHIASLDKYNVTIKSETDLVKTGYTLDDNKLIDGNWQIKHSVNGAAATLLGELTSIAKDATVGLTVDGKGLTVKSGDEVIVQAFVLVQAQQPENI